MPPISRREALAAAVPVTAGLLGASAAPVPKGDNKSWVGKTVLPKKPDPSGSSAPTKEDDTSAVFRTLYGASWEVKAEKGTRVEVFEGGAACWVEKDHLVLLADAETFFTAALKAAPADAYAHNFRGWGRYLLGKSDEAVKDFTEFLRLMADAAPGHRVVGLSNRGAVLAEMGKFDLALKDLDAAVELGHAPAQLNRGWAYELKGEYKKAGADYAALFANNPNDVLALNNAAWLKATCPDANLRDGPGAVKLATRACELTSNRDGMCLDTLAAAHAEAGDFGAALKAQEKALADPGYAKKHGDGAQQRLQLYKDRKPFRSEPVKAK